MDETTVSIFIPRESLEPLISVSGLSHAYGEGQARRVVLRDVSLDFYPGEIVIIMGPSGAGKTTLLTLAGALRSPQSGSVRVGSVELRGAGPAGQIDVRRRIGFIFQSHNLLPALTACENVQMGLAYRTDIGRAESRERARRMLARVGLADHADKHPSEMSGGQCQRVAIARALVREPVIVMADEPTAALDKQSGREIVDLLQHLARAIPCAILLVTHDSRILDVADRILMLEDGQVEETHRGLERISATLQDLMRLLSRYTSRLGDDAGEAGARELQEWQQEFRRRRREVRVAITEVAARRLNPRLETWAARLQDTYETLRGLEDGLREFGSRVASRPAGARALPVDSFLQSLDFLLITAAEAMTSGTADDIEGLRQVTSDNGTVVESLRERYSDTREMTKAARDYLFDLISLFSRLVYFLRRLASLLEAR